ncbi:Mbov_0399 family ICE element protein [[Mycoplasma] collis]|uniref:Mbov_0399 family ICE element protein n=1 Tax=[Mycoplasma] collis TaxID=2127 RepID=UPI0038CC188B
MVDVKFYTTEKEDEILFINGQKVDVLDKHFEYKLEDLRLSKKSDDDEKENSNEYRIEVIKYKKSDINQENEIELKKYYIDIVIESINNILNAKWFAWDPKNNSEQQKLIEPYLLNPETKEPLVNEKGEKIVNPNYDPLIDANTGTKKQLVWVEFGNDKKLPNNTRFLQDPLDINFKLMPVHKYKWGFIAEAAVLGKGANLTLIEPSVDNEEKPKQVTNSITKRFKVKNIRKNFELTNDTEKNTNTSVNGASTKFSTNDKNYFSSSGIWLFTSRTAEGIDSYKIIEIGDNEPDILFTDSFANEKVKPFWTSVAGVHLANYLAKIKKYNKEQIEKFSYEQVLSFWKEYISFSYNNETLYRDLIYISPQVDEIELRKAAKITTKEEFFKSLNINNYLKNFDYKEKVKTSYTWNNSLKQLVIQFAIKDDNIIIDDYLIEPDLEEIVIDNLYFKGEKIPDELLEDSELNDDKKLKNDVIKKNENQIVINPVIKLNELKEFAKSQSQLEFRKQPLNTYLNDFKDSDKTYWKIKYHPSSYDEKYHITIQFFIKKEYENDYYLFENFYKVYLEFNQNDVNIKILDTEKSNENDIINIFENLKLDLINLKGITNQKQAEKYIVDILSEKIDTKFKYNQQWKISNLESVVKNAVKIVYQKDNENIAEFLLNLEAIANSKSNFIGKKIIKLINAVDNVTIPNEQDLLNIKLSTIKTNISNKEQLKNKIIADLNQQLKKYDMNYEEYLEFNDWDEILNQLIQVNKINVVEIELSPKNFLIFNKLKLKILNNMKRADDLTYNPYEDPELDDESKIEKILQEQKIDEKSENLIKKINNKKRLYWLIPLVIVSIISVIGIILYLYNRYGQGKKIK